MPQPDELNTSDPPPRKPTRVALLHGYSADNLGDGLLVTEALDLLREALPDELSVTVCALHPETFKTLGVPLISSRPRSFKDLTAYFAFLGSLGRFDLIVGVGGGYLRFGTARESVKTTVAHLPQLVAASRRGATTLYLPQSVGPAPRPIRRVLAYLLRRLRFVNLRDDRSIEEFQTVDARRTCDVAIMQHRPRVEPVEPLEVCVLSVRPISGSIPPPVRELAKRLGSFDGYVQSATGSNQDTEAMMSLNPRSVLSRNELLDPQPRRVVVAVRLHAALMAIAAGHYVLHLAYERKGFGAFSDLGLDEYVHPVSHFDPDSVIAQVEGLQNDAAVRAAYLDRVDAGFARAKQDRAELISQIRTVVGNAPI